MKKWAAVIVLGAAQFVMVLDSTVMNVSISTVVEDLDSSVEAMQAAITFYSLVMASFMILGAKLGDIWGRRRAFVIGSLLFGIGSFVTALSVNMPMLMIGWSVTEGLASVLVIPAIAALVADNYTGRDRISAYAIIGAISGAAVAAGPLIGGFVTTYLDWRWVFASEVFIMIAVVAFVRVIRDSGIRTRANIDALSVALSAGALLLIVFGMLQSKTWGWVLPIQTPQLFGVDVAPFGLSIVPFILVVGFVLLRLFWVRQLALEERGRTPLIDVSMFRITALRSGVMVLGAQYAIIGGVFFMIPVYLQMTLGLDALETGLRIFPLSLSLMVFSFVGTRLSDVWSPRRIVRTGQYVLVLSVLVLLASVDVHLASVPFAIAMFAMGAGLGLLASQLGNVTMSAVDSSRSSEVGGVQGVFQNFGSSLGTALIGSVLILSLTSSFDSSVARSDLPDTVKTQVEQATAGGVQIVPDESVQDIAQAQGIASDDAATLTNLYRDSQVDSLRVALLGLLLFSAASLAFSRGIPREVLGRQPGTAVM